jgi:hypothetical protein
MVMRYECATVYLPRPEIQWTTTVVRIWFAHILRERRVSVVSRILSLCWSFGNSSSSLRTICRRPCYRTICLLGATRRLLFLPLPHSEGRWESKFSQKENELAGSPHRQDSAATPDSEDAYCLLQTQPQTPLSENRFAATLVQKRFSVIAKSG